MQTMIDAGPLGVALDGISEPIDVFEARQAAPAAEPLLFETVTRKKASDGAVLGLIVFLYAAGLATGLWMALDVAQGLAIAERCDGRCAEAAR